MLPNLLAQVGGDSGQQQAQFGLGVAIGVFQRIFGRGVPAPSSRHLDGPSFFAARRIREKAAMTRAWLARESPGERFANVANCSAATA